MNNNIEQNRIVVNPNNLIADESWMFFRKVRAIIENKEGLIALSVEGGKYIFPGGKCDSDEPESIAIRREVLEETGIEVNEDDIEKALVLETFYDDFYDFRSNSIRPRYTITTYFYIKTNRDINEEAMQLTDGEKKQNFKSFFVDKETLLNMLNEDHSHLENGKFFDEENKIVVDEILIRKRNNNHN